MCVGGWCRIYVVCLFIIYILYIMKKKKERGVMGEEMMMGAEDEEGS